MITKLPFKGTKLIKFLYISNAGTAKLNNLDFSYNLSSEQIKSILNELIKEDYISYDEINQVYSPTDNGKEFLVKFNRIGLDYINTGEFDDAIISFLYLLNEEELFPYRDFPSCILEKATAVVGGMDAATNLLEWMHGQNQSPKRNYYTTNPHDCFLKKDGRIFFEDQLKEKEKQKEKETIEKEDREMERELKKLNIKNLKKIVANYEKDQDRLKNTFRISVVAIIISVVVLIFQYIVPLFTKIQKP